MSVVDTIRAGVAAVLDQAEQEAAASPIVAALERLATPLDSRFENLIASQIRSAGAAAAKVAELNGADPGG